MSDGIVPAIEFADAAEGATAFGTAPANSLASSSVLRKRRTLDLRRTETPGVGDMPGGLRKHRHRRRYAVVMLDSDGRLSDQQLFSQLGWIPGARVDIGVGDGHEIVVRHDEEGAWALTARNMVLIPAPLRRWCGYDAGDPVLVVAVPSMSAVVLHPLETLDQALPDPRRIVERMHPPARRPVPQRLPRTATTTSSPPGVDPRTATGLRVRQVRVMAVGSTQADVQALVQLMHAMNVEPEELLAAARPQNVPTFEEFMPLVRAAASPGLQRSYKSYWDRIVESWGGRRLNEPTPQEVGELLEHIRANAQRRRTHVDGAGAVCNLYYALLRVYRLAIDQEVLSSRQDPMPKVPRPRSAKSQRHALSPQLYQEIVRTAVGTGRDPRLDGLILRFHLETAARRAGALNLRPMDLDPERLLVSLTEKRSIQRLQPVSGTLMRALLDHAEERGVRDKASPLFRFSDGRPLTKRRYETLWIRVGKDVPAIGEENISMHWLRHTTLTWVERNFGLAVAVAYAGHSAGLSLWRGVTAHYVKASLEEVATALQALTGEPHPLAADWSWSGAALEVHPLQEAGR